MKNSLNFNNPINFIDGIDMPNWVQNIFEKGDASDKWNLYYFL